MTVEVWSRHGDLDQDLVDLGSPAAQNPATTTTVEGHEARAATGEAEGKELHDLVVHVGDELLVVLVQRFVLPGAAEPEVGGADAATVVAEQVLTELAG